MTGIASAIMASALRRDLLARGVQHIGIDDCEAMVSQMFRSVHTVDMGTRDDDTPPSRCETGEVDLDATCMVCGASEGETCRQIGG